MDIRLDGYTATHYQINPDTGDCAYHLEATNKEIPPCPKCGGREVVVHGNRVRKTRDCGICGSAVELRIHCRRYRCKKCKETFSDAMPFIDEDAKLTNRFKAQLIFQVRLAHNFSAVGAMNKVSTPTVERIFKAYVAEMETGEAAYAPEILGIDEAHVNGRERAVFTDIVNHRLIDMLADRTDKTVTGFLESMQRPERIKAVVTDMYQGYRAAVQYCLPGVPVVIDRFHVMQCLNRHIMDEWKRGLEGEKKRPTGVGAQKALKLLRSNQSELTKSEIAELLEFSQTSPLFGQLQKIKEGFRFIYIAKTRRSAQKKYEEWEKEIPKKLREIQKFIRTVHQWYDEIFNYFDYPYTNGYTEAINGQIKRLSRMGNGYSFPVLRAKALYEIKHMLPDSYFEKIKIVDSEMRMAKAAMMTPSMLPFNTESRQRGIDWDVLLREWDKDEKEKRKVSAKFELGSSPEAYITVTDNSRDYRVDDKTAYQEGYAAGLLAGEEKFASERKRSYEQGYSAGQNEVQENEYTAAYDEGYQAGYEAGYSDGFDEVPGDIKETGDYDDY